MAYLATGMTLAISRLAMLTWLVYYWPPHETDYAILRFLRPEDKLAATNLLPIYGVHNDTLRIALFGSLVTVGSFIMATPILLVGWLWQRRG